MGEVDPHVWDRFDMVAVLSYTGYQDRQPALWAELERVGLARRVEIFWNYPTPFVDRLAASVRISKSIADTRSLSCALGHYRILKTAVELGRASVLVLEDDIRFLRDLDALSAAVRGVPADFDVAKLEWYPRGPAPAGLGGPWAPVAGFDTYGGGATAYSARGAAWKARCMESPLIQGNLHSLLWINDAYDTARNLSDAGLSAYVAFPVLAIQDNASRVTVHRRTKGYGDFLSGATRDSYEGYPERHPAT